MADTAFLVLGQIGAAIQYRVLGILQVKLDQIKREDAERREAEEEERAAARFKNHQTDLEKWENKYGSGSKSGGFDQDYDSSGEGGQLAILNKEKERDRSSSLYSLMRQGTNGEYSSLGQRSPTFQQHGDHGSVEMMRGSSDARSLQSNGILPAMQLGDSIAPSLGVGVEELALTPEEKERQRLMDEIKEVRKSIDVLRATTPTSLISPSTSEFGFGTAGDARSRRQSQMSFGAASFASGLGTRGRIDSPNLPEPTPKEKEWNDYLAERKLFTPPTGITAPIETSVPPYRSNVGRLSKIPDSVLAAVERRERTLSAFEMGSAGIKDGQYEELAGQQGAADKRYSGMSTLQKRHSTLALVQNEGSSPVSPTLPSPPATAAVNPRNSRLLSNQPVIVGHAHSNVLNPNANVKAETQRPKGPERIITYDELAARHRAKLTQMQNPVTEVMKDQLKLAETKAQYDKQRDIERRTMAMREADRAKRASAGPDQMGEVPRQRTKSGDQLDVRRVPKESGFDRAAQWRQSVVVPDQPRVATTRQEGNQPRDDRRRSTTLDAAMGSQSRRQSRGPNHYVN